MARLYVHGGRVDEMVASQGGGQWRYHHYDARGHCLLFTSPSGALLEQYEYDAFGFPYFHGPSGAKQGPQLYGNRFLFTGREWLGELRLYDYRHRMYQPELGRFLQPDPKQFEAGDYNLYRYCHNDPVNKSDPTGLAPDDRYPTADAAAVQAINDINETSIIEGREYAGRIYRNFDNTFSFTAPNRGVDDRASPGWPLKERINEGTYHTHGKNDIGAHNEEHSKGDKLLNDREQTPGYLGTPNRDIKKYNPDPKNAAMAKSKPWESPTLYRSPRPPLSHFLTNRIE